MKKKYLFPLIYLVLLALSYVVPGMGDYVVILTYPVIMPIFFLSLWLGGPRDPVIADFIASFGQFFVLGAIWDAVAARLKKAASSFRDTRTSV